MNTLELFAGTQSFSKVAKKLGHNTFTSDYCYFDGIDYQCDIMHFKLDRVPYQPDIIWASPPCTSFSVSSIGSYYSNERGKYTPKKAETYLGMAYVQKAIDIIKHFNPKYWYIENPRGVLRKLGLMQGLTRHTIWYCQYSDPMGEDHRAKPTDIWTNDESWLPRPVCKNGNRNCHHQPAPRGSKSGTQGMKDAIERSKIPPALFYEILQNIAKR
tara:strand:+ start:51 stop:692 length:642 start_codon:yes stop_codon:yes gene_type:complete